MRGWRAPTGNRGMTRRGFLLGLILGGALAFSAARLFRKLTENGLKAETFIAQAKTYDSDLASIILHGLLELGITEKDIRGKRVLLKPNLVEPHRGVAHINTHPLVVRAAIEAFMHMGAACVLVAEGAEHCRDSMLVLEESGFADMLHEDRVPFVDLNYDACHTVANAGGFTRLGTLHFPNLLRRVDWVVSMPKMKTHHWTGVTLSMKNLFGLMPGEFYGWPKNVLHHHGIENSILDINATVRPHLAIVDGIVGMEGDGPIMGNPRHAGVLVMGANLPAVDATCARIMGIDPSRIDHLARASGRLGPIREKHVFQCGERIASVRTPFELMEKIPVLRKIQL